MSNTDQHRRLAHLITFDDLERLVNTGHVESVAVDLATREVRVYSTDASASVVAPRAEPPMLALPRYVVDRRPYCRCAGEGMDVDERCPAHGLTHTELWETIDDLRSRLSTASGARACTCDANPATTGVTDDDCPEHGRNRSEFPARPSAAETQLATIKASLISVLREADEPIDNPPRPSDGVASTLYPPF